MKDANTSEIDEIELLKKELLQFLLKEMSRGKDGAALKRQFVQDLKPAIDEVLQERVDKWLCTMANDNRAALDKIIGSIERSAGKIRQSVHVDKYGGREALPAGIEQRLRSIEVALYRLSETQLDAQKPIAEKPVFEPPACGQSSYETASQEWSSHGSSRSRDEPYTASEDEDREDERGTPGISRWLARLPVTQVVLGVVVIMAFALLGVIGFTIASRYGYMGLDNRGLQESQNVAAAPDTQAPFDPEQRIGEGWRALLYDKINATLLPYGQEGKVALDALACKSKECPFDEVMKSATRSTKIVVLQAAMAKLGNRCQQPVPVAITGKIAPTDIVSFIDVQECLYARKDCETTNGKICPPEANTIKLDEIDKHLVPLTRWALWRIGSP